MTALWRSAAKRRLPKPSAVGLMGEPLALALVLIALLLSVPAGLGAFERLCQPIEFCVLDTEDGEVRYTINLASLAANPLWKPGYVVPPFDPVPVIHRAFQAWQDARGHFLRFRYEPNAVFNPADQQPLLEVYFSPGPTRAYALAQRAGRTRYGQARMATDHGTFGIDRERFYADLLHEVGHLLGLDHPKAFPSIGGPVMGYGGVPIGVEWFPLDPDDVAGLRFLYPVPINSFGEQRVVRPEVEIWPASGPVPMPKVGPIVVGQPIRFQDVTDFQAAVSHPNGRAEISSVQVLVNSEDVTPGAAWLFGMFGRLTPFGYILSVPPDPWVNLVPLLRLGLRCGTTLECTFFPPRSLGPTFTITVIARDRSGQEVRLERTYTIVP